MNSKRSTNPKIGSEPQDQVQEQLPGVVITPSYYYNPAHHHNSRPTHFNKSADLSDSNPSIVISAPLRKKPFEHSSRLPGKSPQHKPSRLTTPLSSIRKFDTNLYADSLARHDSPNPDFITQGRDEQKQDQEKKLTSYDSNLGEMLCITASPALSNQLDEDIARKLLYLLVETIYPIRDNNSYLLKSMSILADKKLNVIARLKAIKELSINFILKNIHSPIKKSYFFCCNSQTKMDNDSRIISALLSTLETDNLTVGYIKAFEEKIENLTLSRPPLSRSLTKNKIT